MQAGWSFSRLLSPLITCVSMATRLVTDAGTAESSKVQFILNFNSLLVSNIGQFDCSSCVLLQRNVAVLTSVIFFSSVTESNLCQLNGA